MQHLARVAPRVINARRPARNHLPGLRAAHFANYPEGVGYYTWLFQIMFRSEREQAIHLGRFENLREEALRLFEETGTPVTDRIARYLGAARPLNASPRPKNFVGAYPPELEHLVAEQERTLIDRFGYEFSEAHKYPKTDYFKHLGSADLTALIQRVKEIPETLWESQNEAKPNKIAQLNDTRHIMFRFITDTDRVFDFSDLRTSLRHQPPSPTGSWESNSSEGTAAVSPKHSPRLPQRSISLSCNVCRSREVCAALIPCGHNLFCHICAHKISTSHGSCPVCRSQVTNMLRLYQ